MIQAPINMKKELSQGEGREYQVHASNQFHVNNDFKLPTRKEKESLLLRYARKLGVNERGCYVTVGLSVFTFLLIIIIIIMAACWPGNIEQHPAFF